MWWRKPKAQVTKEKQEVKCANCLHKLDKLDCVVREMNYTRAYFCRMHIPKWDEATWDYRHGIWIYMKITKSRVNEDGSDWIAPKPKKGKKAK